MSFEQTTIFYNLVNAFNEFGNKIRYDTGRTETARAYAERFARTYGAEKIKKVCARANKSLKAKIFIL